MSLPDSAHFLPLHPEEPIQRSANRLPHWEQEGRTYLITFRLADSLPRSVLETWDAERQAWLHWHPEPWSEAVEREYHQRFTQRWEQALDEGHGSCVLRDPACAAIVGRALSCFAGQRCEMFAWVVMPNHVHVLTALIAPWELAQLLHSWKSFTAKEINRHRQTIGAVWQKDYHDRLLRDEAHFRKCVAYLRNNGPKAYLPPQAYLYWEADWLHTIA